MFSKMQNDFLKNKHLNNVHLGLPQRKRKPCLILQDKQDSQINGQIGLLGKWRQWKEQTNPLIHTNIFECNKMLTTVMWLKQLFFSFKALPVE